jgi:hypothetical protein
MNVTRAQIVDAVRLVLGRRESTQIFGDHLEIGGLIANELRGRRKRARKKAKKR